MQSAPSCRRIVQPFGTEGEGKRRFSILSEHRQPTDEVLHTSIHDKSPDPVDSAGTSHYGTCAVEETRKYSSVIYRSVITTLSSPSLAEDGAISSGSEPQR